MIAFLVGGIMLWVGIKLGRKYQDFADLMLARRVAKIVDQREKFSKEHEEYERWERQDKRLGRLNEKLEKELES